MSPALKLSDRLNPYLIALESLNESVLFERNNPSTLDPDRFELTVAGLDWLPYASDVNFENTDEDGGATLTFNSKRPMDELGDAEVRLWVDGTPYFWGNLKRPAQAQGSRFIQGAIALGPFAAMASQFFGEQVSYTNHYLNDAIFDITGRAYTVSGVVDVIGGERIVIEEADFTEETSLMEGAKAICDPTDFVMLDTGLGERRFMRRPRPDNGRAAVRAYTSDDYEDGQFTIEQKYDGSYASVVVFRRNETGGYDVREEFPVEQVGLFKAPRRRIYFVPDFPGNATQAKQLAYEIARSLIEGEVNFNLTVPLDASVSRYDPITCSREVERSLPKVGLYRETYALVIESGLSAELGGESMTLSGSGYLLRRERIEDSQTQKRRPRSLSNGSPYLVRGN